MVQGDVVGKNVFEMPLPSMAALICGNAVKHGLVGGPLQIHIERGVDPQTAFMDLVAAIFVLEVSPNLFHVVGRERVRIMLHIEHDCLRFRLGSLLGGDLAIFQHRVDHEVAALQSSIRMHDRRVILRSLGQAGEQSGFVQRQLLRRRAEVVFRRGLEPVRAMTQENLIGVKREDLRLRKPALNLNREQHFLNFSMERAVWRKEQVAGQLHRESRCALHSASRFNIAIGRAHDAPDVDAGMLEKLLVLGGDQGVPKNLRIVFVGATTRLCRAKEPIMCPWLS